MATQAQILANQANAQHSTGPKTEEGKARASRNNTKHGLTLGVLAIPEAEAASYAEREAKLRAECKPFGTLEEEAFRQFIDGANRIRRIRDLISAIVNKYDDFPGLVPEAEAELRQLTRYRAAAEMLLYRSIATLRELQSTRLYRYLHLTKEEAEVIPDAVRPSRKLMLGGELLGRNDRAWVYFLYECNTLDDRLPALPCRPGHPDWVPRTEPVDAAPEG